MGFRLTPQDPSFFELFTASARQLVEGTSALTSLLGADTAERQAVLARMRDIESASDDVTHEVVRRVNGSFVTPFDRSDMHGLAVLLHQCVDLVGTAVDLLVLYRIDEVPPRVVKQVEHLGRMADVTAEAMPRLRTMKDLDGYWVEITRLENRVGKQNRKMLAELFDAKKPDVLTILKLKDVLAALAAAAAGIEQVALKVEAISVRES
ncbi:DUF47 domain-containing protein [Phycicoccus flavus]|uniref:DUF47 domain-containing protein n=1 Tax=Phycicoccus flavus TaxID=2502783 RepID=UPI000FEBD7CD|nr:DUF47 family protein [Phycicoccus flavus]NHA66620.1 DUF47 family protein [Phycicoccus flavus]